MNTLKAFLIHKISLAVCLSSIFLSILAYFIFLKEEDLFIDFENPKLGLLPYADKVVKGNSKILNSFRNKNSVGFKFMLKEGFMFPYAGLTVICQRDTFIDVSKILMLQLKT